MEKIYLLIQTEKELVSVNRYGFIIGRINSTNIILGYDEAQVILLYNASDLLFTCEIRYSNLKLNQILHEPINECIKYINKDTSKYFPIYSLRFTQKEYTEFIKCYSVLEQEERKITVWKCAYSFAFDFLKYISNNNLVLISDFHQIFLELFEYEIEQDVLFQSKKRIFNRLEKIFQKIVVKLINEEIIQFKTITK